jgi:hypothetical protein
MRSTAVIASAYRRVGLGDRALTDFAFAHEEFEQMDSGANRMTTVDPAEARKLLYTLGKIVPSGGAHPISTLNTSS